MKVRLIKETSISVLTCFVLVMPTQALADGDAEAGEREFRRCASCHQIGPDARNTVGPTLNGIVGGEIASVEGFPYSDAFLELAAEGFTWTEATLDEYLANPREAIPGTSMRFAGVRQDTQRADLIALLETLSE